MTIDQYSASTGSCRSLALIQTCLLYNSSPMHVSIAARPGHCFIQPYRAAAPVGRCYALPAMAHAGGSRLSPPAPSPLDGVAKFMLAHLGHGGSWDTVPPEARYPQGHAAWQGVPCSTAGAPPPFTNDPSLILLPRPQGQGVPLLPPGVCLDPGPAQAAQGRRGEGPTGRGHLCSPGLRQVYALRGATRCL